MKKTVPENLKISYCTNRKSAGALALFFARNVDTSYISHSEMQYGRAVSANRWSSAFPDLLRKEFAGLAKSSGREKDVFRLVQAELNGAIAGVAVVEFNNESIRPFAVLEDMVVDNKLRGAGIGARMLAWIEAEAVKRKIPEIYLESGIKNAKAHEFFDKHEFVVVSKVMMKDLR
jgi:N-acetylglutamate synthase-like GNAT family acetyltransferase